MKSIKIIAIAVIAFFATATSANVKLPHVISSNMVLQRNEPIKIWGWADKGEKVSVTFNGKKVAAKRISADKWEAIFPATKEGGPYEIIIVGKNRIELKNIMIGDVWICSGQSNMEWTLQKTDNVEAELAVAENNDIRLLNIPQTVSEIPVDDMPQCEWKTCSAETAAEFSGVGYYFGKYLQQNIGVPIGLINTSWGGTLIETWMSAESIAEYPEYAKQMEAAKDSKMHEMTLNMEARMADWNKNTETDKGDIEKWYLPETDFSSWEKMEVPQMFDVTLHPNLDGSVWYEREIELTADEASGSISLSLGTIDDNDVTYLNGQIVGVTNDYSKPRNYAVKQGIAKAGKNILVVKIVDNLGGGGFYGDPEKMSITTNSGTKNIAGKWNYKIGFGGVSPLSFTSPNTYPTLLFNAMINPLLSLKIKGAIWYQGEANVRDAEKYSRLFTSMIADWRKKWEVGNFPFLFVQLANFDPTGTPDYGDWPTLRASQTKVWKTVEKTGMAVIIDKGSTTTIHPTDKAVVGKRLCLQALKVAYNQDVKANSPLFKSMEIKGNKAIISFDYAEGLKTSSKYGYVNGFEIAGADKKWHWATAEIVDGKIEVLCREVTEPKYVRYAWANDPNDVNLTNTEDLPAVPFNTMENN